MVIKKTRLRNIENYLGFLEQGSDVVLAVPVTDELKPLLRRVGFTDSQVIGESVLPADEFGPVSDRNANGWEEVHRDQEMETAYRQIEWHWVEWHGPDRVDQWEVIDVPYLRYPRTHHDPPSVELSIAEAPSGERLVPEQV